jgi:lipopolysaccharide biosynthesis glycosyltransferase
VKIAIVTLATKDYLIGMHNLFLSLQNLNRNFAEIEFFCISDCQNEFEFVGNRPIRYVDLFKFENLGNLGLSDRFSITIHKLQIFDILQKSDFDRLIFLDSDILCVSKITSLLESQFHNEYFLAVRDYSCGKYYGERINMIGLNENLIFNTGLLVLNKNILELLNFEKIIRILESDVISYDGGDQGLLNYIFQKLTIPVTFLPGTYNDALDFNYPVSFAFPKLIHFTGPKPWKSQNKNRYYDKNYYRYYKTVMKFHEKSFYKKGFRVIVMKQFNNILLLICIFERSSLKFLYRVFKR